MHACMCSPGRAGMDAEAGFEYLLEEQPKECSGYMHGDLSAE